MLEVLATISTLVSQRYCVETFFFVRCGVRCVQCSIYKHTGNGSTAPHVRNAVDGRKRFVGLGSRVRRRGHVVRVEYQLPDRTGNAATAVQGHRAVGTYGQVPTNGYRCAAPAWTGQHTVVDEGTTGRERARQGTGERGCVVVCRLATSSALAPAQHIVIAQPDRRCVHNTLSLLRGL
jgi:hypothetical protein